MWLILISVGLSIVIIVCFCVNELRKQYLYKRYSEIDLNNLQDAQDLEHLLNDVTELNNIT